MDQRLDRALSEERARAEAPPAAPSMLDRLRGLGLSAKLLLLTSLFVMLAEILIFVPSVANFRINWLLDRLTAAQLASLAAEASPTGDVPFALQSELLRTAQVRSVSVKRSEQRQLILQTDMPVAVDQTYDLSIAGRGGTGATWSSRFNAVWDAVAVFLHPDGRMLRVVGRPGEGSSDVIEIVLPEAPLKSAMYRFSLNILGLSVIISLITAALVYMALNQLLVRPMMRIARNMLHFSENPEDRSRIITPSTRADEVGIAERELAHMQGELAQLLNQKNRLAALGLAVSKINHDLRNLLANTQLLSDRLTSSPDPTVQRFAPKLMESLDRAIAFCNDTLKFGKAAEQAPRRELFSLKAVVDEVSDGLDLPRETIAWRAPINADVKIDADRGHLFRILTNLVRNAIQAIEAQGTSVKGEVAVIASRNGGAVKITITDTGPGVPKRAREHLFQAFQGSARKGGTGLGLAIAHELVVAHGGTLELVDSERGAVFAIVIPDRSAST